MSPIAAILIVVVLGWIWYEAAFTPVTEDREQDYDDTERFYHDKYDQ